MAPKNKTRLDVLLVERGLVESREKARRLIMAGEVYVDDRQMTKPGSQVSSAAPVRIAERPRFVSRGGEKLAGALEHFAIDPTGWACADVGASTGGFTDCLLQNGAARVYAIDVGYGQLAWSLRQDERVIAMERVNARHLESLPEPIDFACADVSFISLELILPAVRRWLTPYAQLVTLVKPQFEAGREDVGKGGVVKDPLIHERVLLQTIGTARDLGFVVLGLIPSPLYGPSGNAEFLLWLSNDQQAAAADIDAQVQAALAAIHPPAESD